MDFLEIRAVVAGARVLLDGTDPATGKPVRTTIYSGHVALARSASFRGMVRVDDLQQISFYLPDSTPYPEPPANLGVELSVRRFKSTAEPGQVHFGVCDERVAVAADPRGGDSQWLLLTFHTLIYSHELLDINYRVTAQSG